MRVPAMQYPRGCTLPDDGIFDAVCSDADSSEKKQGRQGNFVKKKSLLFCLAWAVLLHCGTNSQCI